MRAFVLLALLGPACFAQTAVFLEQQVRGPIVSQPVVFVCVPPGTTTANCQLIPVRIGAGLVLDLAAGELRAPAAQPPAATPKVESLRTTSTITAYTLTHPPLDSSAVAYYRNGLRQREESDYKIAGRSITFVEASRPRAGDDLIFQYEY